MRVVFLSVHLLFSFIICIFVVIINIMVIINIIVIIMGLACSVLQDLVERILRR